MKHSLKASLVWLLLGPVSALLISLLCWPFYDYLSPGKLSPIPDMLMAYPMGLLMSLLTPWGWLMYGGLLLSISGRNKAGLWCTIGGALLLGGFWPVWATFLSS